MRDDAVSETVALDAFVRFEADEYHVHFIEMADGIVHVAMHGHLKKLGVNLGDFQGKTGPRFTLEKWRWLG